MGAKREGKESKPGRPEQKPGPAQRGPFVEEGKDFTTQTRKAISLLREGGKSGEGIADALTTIAALVVDGIPVSFERFAELMVREGLGDVEMDMLYRARKSIKDSMPAEGPDGNPSSPSIHQLLGIYNFIGKDKELFGSFADYCRKNIGQVRIKGTGLPGEEGRSQERFEAVFKEWVSKNRESLPIKTG